MTDFDGVDVLVERPNVPAFVQGPPAAPDVLVVPIAGPRGADGDTPPTDGFVTEDDPRLDDDRIPLDGTVDDSKIVPGGLSSASIPALAAALEILLGLGTAATHAASDFDPAGAAVGAAAASQPRDAGLTQIAALGTTAFGRAMLTLADAPALRTAAGLGTAATQPTGAFDPAGAADAAAAASQPRDADLTQIAALTTTGYGRGLLTAADAAALRTTAGLGTAATQSIGAFDAAGAAADALTAAQAYADSVKSQLLGGAPAAALDTIQELGDKLTTEDSAIAGVVASLANRALLTDPRFTDTRTPTDGTVTDAKIVAGGLAPGSVAGLVAALAAAALDANVVHLTGAETISGSKSFSGTMNVNGTAVFGAVPAYSTGSRTTSAAIGTTANPVQWADASTGAITLTLPSTTSKLVYTLMKTDASANGVTITSAGTPDINGSASVLLGAQYDYLILIGGGVAGQWKIIGGTVSNARCKTTVYATPGAFTWTKDPRSTIVEAEGIGGAWGGGSGAVVASGTACSGGAGGAPGAYFLRKFIASTLPATLPVTCGAGSTGGAAVVGAVVNTAGNSPTVPGTTSFGATATYTAYASPNATAPKGGQIAATAASTTNLGMFMGIAGATGNNGAAGSAGTNSSFSGCVAPSAGAGGGISAAAAAFTGGAGGQAFGSAGAGGGPGGATGGIGGNGTGVAALLLGQVTTGSAGGGGGGNPAGNGGAGGNGSAYGAPGGGGGSCLVGSSSGKGGDGAQGILVVREWF